MKNYKQMTVGGIVADCYESAVVFNKYGIDFCCGGNVSFTEACRSSNVDADKLVYELSQIDAKVPQTIDFKNWPMDLLVDYVIKYHHRNIRVQGAIIRELLDKIVEVHGANHPSLYEVHDLFYASCNDLDNHLGKEENVLFPYFYELYDAEFNHHSISPFHCGSVANPIAVMMNEHDAEGERFRKISQLTSGYVVPDDACNTYRLAFALLKTFEENLQHHIHLENNILFPMAIRMQQELEK